MIRGPKLLRLSRRWLVFPPILLGGAIVFALAASRKELQRTETQESALPLEFISVTRVPMRPQMIAYGTAEPSRRWMAVSEVGGRVDSIRTNLESGVPVRKGELLVSIDPLDYKLRLEQREADLRQAKAQLVQLRLNQAADAESLTIQQDLFQVRKNEVARLQTLRSRSAASESELDSMRAALLQQKQSVQTLLNSISTYDAQIESAEASISLGTLKVKEALRDVERTQIHSPFDGLLFGVDLEQGQYVAPGQTLFEVIDTSCVEVEAQVSTSQWSRALRSIQQVLPNQETMAIGLDEEPRVEPSIQKFSSMSDAIPNLPAPVPSLRGFTAVLRVHRADQTLDFEGIPIRMTSTLDESTRTMGIVIRVDNPIRQPGVMDRTKPHLSPGTYCEVLLRPKTSVSAFRVPRSSIEDGTVLCIDKDNRLRRRIVTVAFTQDEHVAVSEGLKESDRVVVSPPAIALDGQLTQPIAKTPRYARLPGAQAQP